MSFARAEFAAWLGLVPRQNAPAANPGWRNQKARQSLSAAGFADQWGKRQSLTIEGDQSRSMVW